MASDRIMKIGMVGCGGIAQAHARAINASPLLSLEACADVVPGKADEYARKFNVPHAFNSMEYLVGNARVDVVLLATFPANHLKEISTCLDLGAPAILCEKALAMSGEEGEEIRRIVRQSGRFVAEGLTYRHHPQIARVKEIIASGEIGDVVSIQCHFSDYSTGKPDPNNWRNRVELGGGTLAAKGCYLIDAIPMFASSPVVEVSCHTTYHAEGNFDIAQTATMIMENHATGQFESSHRASWRHRISVHGTLGWIEIPFAVVTQDHERHIIVTTGNTYGDEIGTRREETFAPNNSYRLQLENVRATLFDGAVFPMPLDESIAGLHVTSALLESARKRCVVPVRRG